jgi:hypothetical protein
MHHRRKRVEDILLFYIYIAPPHFLTGKAAQNYSGIQNSMIQ